MATSSSDSPTMSRPTSSIVSPRPPRSRTQSLSSDRPSTVAQSLMSAPLSVSPEAAFIAASAASQIVTNDHDSHADTWYDQHGIEPAGETALVSPAALQLVNNFLDQLLLNFLAASKATTLATLRPAVSEVLKPKLAKDAINNADEELREYLGGAEEEDLSTEAIVSPRDYDVELAWKRTRLRCMVYSSLGDMEEEDEDLYMEQENLELDANEHGSGVISPAVAIFLTSVIEYMGELTLTVAGQAAYHRLRTKHEKDLKDGVKSLADVADRIVIEELDMERVAFDRTLGRLWRGWKKRIRAPGSEGAARPFSTASGGHMRRDSCTTEAAVEDDDVKSPQAETIPESANPADITLPMGENDVDEIEVPGLVWYSDGEDDAQQEANDEELTRGRPQSLVVLPFTMQNGVPTPTSSQPQTPTIGARKRSHSLPTPGSSPYRPKVNKIAVDVLAAVSDVQNASETPAAGTTEDAPKDASKVVERAEPAGEDTPNAINRAKRPSRIFTGVPTNGNAPVLVPAPQRKGSLPLPQPADEVASYEKAEILTSARISVAGGSSPALSENGKPFTLTRSSSVHSARIIDVMGPRSPCGSRSPSVETAERMRPASVNLSRTSSLSNQSSQEEQLRPRVIDNISRANTHSASRSPVDRMRGSFSNAATISESEEEEAENSMNQSTPRNPKFPVNPFPATIPEDPQPHVEQRKSSAPATLIPRVVEEKVPELPRKAYGRNGTHTEPPPLSPTSSIGQVSIERVKTKGSDDDDGSRQTHTSGSTSSGNSKLKAVRTREDDYHADDVARNFEELIMSNQTITYTLTPQSMRDIDLVRESSMGPKLSHKGDSGRRSHSRSRSSSATTEARSHRKNGKGSIHDSRGAPSPTSMAPTPGSTTSKSSRPIRSASVRAREPRIAKETTADFAEFIKSTGPMGDNRPAPLRNVSLPSTSAKNSLDSRRVSSISNRIRYQPRDAIADSRADNSDLIDFIRQGPPSAQQNPRIPRTVAPFRNTMDSDQMSNAMGGKAVDATIPDIRSSQASTFGTETSGPSIQSSINSNTGLLKNSQPSGLAPSPNIFDDEDVMPKRKTRRVRDPYAIDLSDEEDDDELLMTPKPPAKREESLAEFLANCEPPPEPVTVPISQKMPKKASAPSLIGRFTRSGHHASSSISSSSPKAPATINESPAAPVRTSSMGYVPIKVNLPPGYDMYGPIDPSPAVSRPPKPSTAGSAGRVPMKKFEPREAVSNASQTSDLASFLRNSEPPPEPMIRPPSPEVEQSSLSRMFGRRKKSSFA